MKTKQGNWIVECENSEQTRIVLNYADKNYDYWGFWKYVWYNSEESYFSDVFKDITEKYTNAELISFADWEKLPNEEVQKELMGWKLAKEEYREVAEMIAYPNFIYRRLEELEEGYNFKKGSEVEERLKQAGVLELWFEPVYKEEPKTDPIVDEVIEEFRSRSELGIKKYGTTLEENKLTFNEWATHMKEELMDGILYLKKLEKETKNKN